MGSMSGWGSLPDSVEVESWQAEERPLAAGERRPRRRIGRKGGGHILFGGRMQEGEGGPLTRTDRMRERDCRQDSMWIAHRRPHLPTGTHLPLFLHVTLLSLPCCLNTFSKPRKPCSSLS